MQTPNNRARRRRIAFVVGLVASLAALFTVLGGAGLAQGVASAAQYQYGKKTTICHKGRTIRVATAGWEAHRRHGDVQGACAADAKRKGKGHGRPEAGDDSTRAAKAEKAPKPEKAESREKAERQEQAEQVEDESPAEADKPERREERGNDGNGRGGGRGRG